MSTACGKGASRCSLGALFDCAVDDSRETLEWIVGRVEKELGKFPHKPLIIFERRTSHIYEGDECMMVMKSDPGLASVL